MDEVGKATENLVEVSSKAFVHPVVNDRIHASVGHGQHVEEQVKVTNIMSSCEGRLVKYQDEVDVIWSPANSKHEDNDGKHFDNLKISIFIFR